MDIQTLRKNLEIVGGKVTITAESGGTAEYKSFFTQIFGTTDITVSGAKPGPDDKGDTVQIVGTASAFLKVDGAPVTATFVLDAASGEVSLDMRFTLPAGWKFSTSFPDLPVSFDFTTQLGTAQVSPLDELDLKSAGLVVNSATASVQITVDGATKMETLPAGLNFVGVMGLGNLLTVFETLAGLPTEYALTGTIVEPAGDTAVALPESIDALPTDLGANPPGITLTADLGFETTLGSALKLTETTFSVYSPLSDDWLSKNPSYEPYAAFHCALEVPSANLKLDLTSKLLKNIPQMVITGTFTGFTLSNLASLIDLAGTGDLESSLPDEVRSLGSKIGELQLIDASISIIKADKGLSVQYVNTAIGMPHLDWSIGDGVFEIDSIVTTFTVSDPFDSAKRKISIELDGAFEIDGAPVDIEASAEYGPGDTPPDYFVNGQLAEAQTLPLKAFFQEYLPGVSPPSDLTIDSLVVNIDLGSDKSFSLSTEMAKDPAWTLPLTANHLQVQDVQVDVSKTFGDEGSLTGSVSGAVIIDTDITLTMSYDPTAGFAMRGDFPDITLAGLIKALVGSETVLPSGFEAIEFTDSTLLITKHDSNFKLSFGTEINTLGSFAFVLVDEDDKWGFAIGIDLKPVQIAQLPGLSDIKPLTEIFSFVGDLVLVAATIPPTDITFPEFSEFENPKISSKKITVPSIGTGQTAGFYVFASTTLSNNDTLEHLAEVLDISTSTELAAGLFIGENPATNSKVFLTVDTVIDNTVPLTGTLGLEMTNDGPAFYMVATATTKIQDQDVEFDVTLTVTALGLFIGGDMVVKSGDGTIDFWVFKLKALALETGISFEDGLPLLGVFAQLNIGEVDSSVAIYIDTADPTASMVAASVSDINLKMVLDELSGAPAGNDGGIEDALAKIGLKGVETFPVSWATYHEALNTYDLPNIRKLFEENGIALPSSAGQIQLVVNKKDERWYMTVLSSGSGGKSGTADHWELIRDGDTINVSLEAQMYAAPKATTIAGISFAAGFNLYAEIDFLIIEDKIEILVEPTKGIGIDVELSKIAIGSETFFSITNPVDSAKGPQLLLSTFEDKNNPIKVFQKRQFKLAGKIDILGFGPTVDIDIEADGAHLYIRDNMPFGFVEITADITATDGMTGTGSAGVGLNVNVDLGKLGSIHVNDDVTATLGLGVTPSDIYCNAGFGFEVGGIPHTIASFDLDVSTQALANLPAEFLKAIEAFFKKLFEEAKKWLEYVKKGIIAGFEDLKKLGGVLIDVFKKTAKEAAIVLKAVGYLASEVATLLQDAYGLAKEEAEKIVNFLWTTLEGCVSETALLASDMAA